MRTTLKNGQAFLCIKDVYYTKSTELSFAAGKLYYVDKDCYLVDDNGTHRNYEWFKASFERSEVNDKSVSKNFKLIKKLED